MSNRGQKRQRTSSTTFVSTRRPIDKLLINVGDLTSGSQQEVVLVTATFPCTITGLRWAIALQVGDTASCTGSWMIVIVRDGNSANTIALSSASSAYEPEQDVLAFGVFETKDGTAGGGNTGVLMEGSTKTMRKLMGGDRIIWIHIETAASGGTFNGIVQMFCKS